jgi:hypothetical protein
MLAVRSFCRAIFALAFAASALLMAALGVAGLEYGTVNLLTTGLLGIALGRFSTKEADLLLSRKFLFATVYLAYSASLAFFGAAYLLQATGVLLNLVLINAVALRTSMEAPAGRTMLLLGKYSLFAYIAQIAVLQAARRFANPINAGSFELAMLLIIPLTITVASVLILDRLRERTRVVDGLYRLAFA